MSKRVVQFLLIDGDAKGRIQAKLDNWTGVAYKIPRLLLLESDDREDLGFCGIYFLLGHDEESDTDAVYIGQVKKRKAGGSLLNRFSEHNNNKGKDFCNEIVFFTTTTDDFGPTEICYLENTFFNMAQKAGRFTVKNANNPSLGNVTEAKQAELDRYVENARILMATLGFMVFKPTAALPECGTNVAADKSIKLYLNRKISALGDEVRAEALWTNEGIVVLKGSDIVNPQVARSGIMESVKALRIKLCLNRILVPYKGEVYRLKEDQLFQSPSAAASFVIGGSAKGRTLWKTADGTTFSDLEKAKAASD